MNQLKTYLFIFLLFNFTAQATINHSEIIANPKVNIELSNITTNGLILPNNTISFNGVEDLEIEFDIKTSYTGNNAKYLDGLLNCYYYEPNSFDNEIAQYYNNGVAPQYLFQKNEKLEYNNGIYSYTYRQKLRFKRSITFNTGCSIVFRYRTETLTADISNKLTYKFTDGTKTGKEPSKLPTANINLTNISYSDGSPLINNQIIVPTSNEHETTTTEIGTIEVDLSFNFNCTYGSKMYLGYYPGVQIQIADNTSVRAYLTEFTTPIVTNGTLTFKNLKIKSSDLSPTSYLKIRFTFQEVQINLNCAIAKSSRPIIYNTISDNQSIFVGGKSKPLTGTIAKLSLDTSNKWYTTDITKYQWQQKTGNNNWANIIGATFQNYSPTNTFIQTTSFRRIAISNEGLYNFSDYITISTIAPPVNTICCDQILPYNTSQPSTFTGNTLESSTSYQWQISQKPSEWINIPNANNQNHNFIFTYVNGKPGIVNSADPSLLDASFRRLIIKNEAIISVSNNIIVTRLDRQDHSIINPTTPPVRIDAKGRRFSSRIIESDQLEINNLSIYPNPIINNFFIEGAL
ncbi:hypothetical protein [uncultured Flavobacterium sp.]|uniref:hypothetical protein n=1 Tax=uncultured Flavobacterium sp. TaxID=165435 RepID=UPI00308199A1